MLRARAMVMTEEPPPPPPPGDEYYRAERARRKVAPLPPHNLDAERALLGAMLLSASKVAVPALGVVTPADFYRPQHRTICRAITEMVGAGEPVDAVTVSERLRAGGLLDGVGGLDALADLMRDVPAISNAEEYARIVADAASLRRLIESAASITDAAMSASSPLAAYEAAGALLAELSAAPAVRAVTTIDVADFDALLAAGMRPPEPDMLRRSDGGPLLYAGKMHTLQAEPSSAKTWIALYASVEVLDMGGAVVYLDYEDTAITIYQRLLALGASAESVRERFRHLSPAGPIGVAERAQLDALLEELNPDLVIIDGVAEALQREGLSEDAAADFVRWADMLPRPMARAGAAVVMIDHLVKDKEQQGRYARGSSAKLAVIDGAVYSVRVITPFSRTKAGAVRLTVAKDKPGGVGAIGEHVAHFGIEPHADGERVVCTLAAAPARAATEGGGFKPTATMSRVMRAVQESDLPMTAAALRRIIPGKTRIVSAAIELLLRDGYLSEEVDGRKKHLVFVRPYSDPSAPSPREAPAEEPAEQLSLPSEQDVASWLDVHVPPPWETNPEEFT